MRDEIGRALLVAMPLRHLEAARGIAETAGSAVLPAGGPGALDTTVPGTHVLIIATESGDAEVPAATWTARFQGRVDHDPRASWPEGLPPTWLEEHGHRVEKHGGPFIAEDEAGRENGEDDDGDEDMVGPQSFFRVSGLRAMPRSEWVFANELVRKQGRGGRTFVPRVPVLVDRPA